jgi:hypothetical protein
LCEYKNELKIKKNFTAILTVPATAALIWNPFKYVVWLWNSLFNNKNDAEFIYVVIANVGIL